MSARQELFAALVDEHFYDSWRCSCGWAGSSDDWVEHFAAILDAESANWRDDA